MSVIPIVVVLVAFAWLLFLILGVIGATLVMVFILGLFYLAATE